MSAHVYLCVHCTSGCVCIQGHTDTRTGVHTAHTNTPVCTTPLTAHTHTRVHCSTHCSHLCTQLQPQTHTCAHRTLTHPLCHSVLPLIQVCTLNLHTPTCCHTSHTCKHLQTPAHPHCRAESTPHPTGTHCAHRCAHTAVPTLVCKHTHTLLTCAHLPAHQAHTLRYPHCSLCTPTITHTHLHIHSGTPHCP